MIVQCKTLSDEEARPEEANMEDSITSREKNGKDAEEHQSSCQGGESVSQIASDSNQHDGIQNEGVETSQVLR